MVLCGLKEHLMKILAFLSLMAIAAEAFLILGSWVVAAIWPNCPIRSLLGSDGCRWLLGSFVDNVSTSPLIWIFLLGGTCGMLYGSRLVHIVLHYKKTTGYERMAVWVVGWELIAMLIAVVLLTFVPHAILLSALGTLFPGTFSHSIIPIITIMGCIAAITYGGMVGTFNSAVNAFRAFSDGLAQTAPIIVFYFTVVELYKSAVWVFGG